MVWPSRNRSFGALDTLGVVGLLGLLVARFIPVARWVPFWGCSFRKATGYPCPGCGLTRVADRVAHGNLAGAWEANPLGTVAALLFALAAGAMVLHLALGVPWPQVSLKPRQRAWAVAVLVGLGAVNYGFVILHTRFPGRF